jgi:hypothetical protein
VRTHTSGTQDGQPEWPPQLGSTGQCRICGGQTRITHRDVILGKHVVSSHLCVACEYWCTDEPYWLKEAYGQAIAATDTGLVQRNISMARALRAVLPRLFPTGPYVDWAGGHGMLVRLLRDAGFEFYWQDRYAENLLARGFAWEDNRNGRDATVVTAVEVLEHTPDPLGFFRECMAGSGAEAVVFTQVLHTGGDDPGWWYLAPKIGQHVSFFSTKTLTRIARKLDMHVRSAGGLHVLTRSPIPAGRLRWALQISRLPPPIWERRRAASLTWSDHQAMTQRVTTEQLLRRK